MNYTLGKYTLVRKLATGGMAEVFLARADGPLGFQKKVVVKRILPHFADDPRFLEMFLGEARLAAHLSHPNLVQIFDFGEADGQYFIAMEYIDGPNLRLLNRQARNWKGPLPLPLVARIVASAAEGLQSAHDLKDEAGRPLNLVHRDISPDNILVARNGAVKVVDFGIAKAANQPHLTKTGAIKGKMAYMPPEQLAREPLDRRTDIYALGIVLYELVAGSMPFDATSEVSIIQAIMGPDPMQRITLHRPDVPPALDAIITRCLEKQPSRRYADCRELQKDLEAFIQSMGQSVGTADIAEVVSTLFPEEEATLSGPVPDPGLEHTAPSRKSAERAAPAAPTTSAPSTHPTGLSHTVLRQVNAGKRRVALVAGVLGVLVVGGVAGALLFGRAPAPVPQPPPVVTPTAGVDAGAAVAATAPVDAGVAEPVDAGAQAQTTEPVDVEPAKTRPARLELRIRPYATVYLDGKKLGDTPLKVQVVKAGKHTLRLVNTKLGKDEEVELVLKPGPNVYKHNLKL